MAGETIDTKLNEIYYDPSQPGSYGSINELIKAAKLKKNKRNTVKEWLSTQDTYTLHKPIKRKFKKRKVFVPGMNHLWQMDLIDIIALDRYNDNYKYILTIIDCFSRFAYAIPLKNKTGQSITNAVSSIIDEGLNQPTYIQTDKGGEFLNATFQKFLKQRHIIHYSVESENKACIVERFNRILKDKMWKYFTKNRTYRYLDVIDKFVKTYNNTFHSSIKTTPANVNHKNESKIMKLLYDGYNSRDKKIKYKFNVGDQVRISGLRKVFDKGYEEKWTNEIFVVSARLPTQPPTYNLKDEGGESIKGGFYAQELQKVKKLDNIFRIEKVLKTRTNKKGHLQHYVKWLGYPAKFNSWVDSLISN